MRNANSPAGKCEFQVRGSSTARLSSVSVSDGAKIADAGAFVPAGRVPLVPDVSDDLPESTPVLDRELEVIESYLGTFLEELFAAPN